MLKQQNTANSILNNILFSGIEDKIFFKKINDSLEKRVLKVSETLFQQGDDIDGLYLILSGQVQVFTIRDGERYALSYAEENHLVGEFLLQGSSVRSVSAQATQDSILYFLSATQLNQLFAEFPEQGSVLGPRIAKRLFWNKTKLALHMSHLFEGLNEKVVRQLVNEMEILSISSNTMLLTQHDVSNDLYVVVDGRFQIYQVLDSVVEELSVVGRGQSLGEIGLISQSPRLANVLAIRDSTVARLTHAAYENILKAFPIEINQTFVRSVINHLSSSKKYPFKAAETFALVNLSVNDKAQITRQLVSALDEFGPATFLNSDSVDAAFSLKGVAQSTFDNELNRSLLPWLSEQEIAYRYLVYVADDSMTQWTKRCLRQADHVLFLADAEGESRPTQLEQLILNELDSKRVKKTLLLNHSLSNAIPVNSVNWLRGRAFDIHHHIRSGVEADFSRVARFLAGKAIGIVLGGGGARGFAHIGVIRAFRTLNIPIDLVGGNSMGALISAQYAMQWTDTEMVNKTRQLCLQGDSFTLPVISLFSGKKMTKGLRAMFADRGIEDLWLHFFSVSCNISRATVMTHDRGSLLAAVLNSNTPPGLFPPQVVDGDLLVDGALLNNVPIDVMAEMNSGGTIIAVDVNAREDLLNNTENCGGVSGWKVLINKLNPMADKVNRPSLIEILSRASIIGGLAQRKKGLDGIADLYLQPPVNEFPLTAYKQAEKIEEAGYQYAMNELQKWLLRTSK